MKIAVYLGTDLNAVLVQIWIAMIAYLLAHLVQQKAPEGAISAQRLMVFVAIRILMNIPLSHAWQDFQRTKRKRRQRLKCQTRNSN
ncbi:MAG TPA: hypothetical protein ENH10_00385 [Bacteroidetes bacterium]|nr:hypothetical protein [Bacteroidota bacterium]HEX03603.1 hypothetical protein [Bacteroidota bacterium]